MYNTYTTDNNIEVHPSLHHRLQKKVEKLVLHTAEGIYFLPIGEVNHFEASGSYTTVWTNRGEKILVSSNLGNFDYLVADTEGVTDTLNVFFRVHHSYIVRLSTVRQFLKLPDGDYAVLNSGAKIPVARRRREAFLAAMC